MNRDKDTLLTKLHTITMIAGQEQLAQGITGLYDYIQSLEETIERQKNELESQWVLDTFENRPKLLEKVLIRRESRSGKINYEVSNTLYDEDDDLMWDLKNKYLGGVTHFKRFNVLVKDHQ